MIPIPAAAGRNIRNAAVEYSSNSKCRQNTFKYFVSRTLTTAKGKSLFSINPAKRKLSPGL